MWDMNGTLINDARYFYCKVLIPILERFGADMSGYKTPAGYEELRSEFSKLREHTFVRMVARQQNLRVTVPTRGGKDREMLLDWDRDMKLPVTQEYRKATPNLMPYAATMLNAYAVAGIPMGLVSGMPHEPLVELLARKDVLRHFDYVLGGVKDKHDAYREFLAWVNCSDMPDAVLAVTDSAADIYEAKLVGMTTVAITKGYGSPESFHEAKPHLVVNDLLELRKFRNVGKMQRIGNAVQAK
jgi:phosphoglycolate phosphatase-like HAD superfamily hydrolase